MTATTTVRPTRLPALQTWILKHKALIAFCAFVGVYYLWTAWSSGSPIAFNENRPDYFNQLSDAFLNGQLHLLKVPDADLLALPNPYDPAVNGNFARQIHDLSLYHDKFYLYWGPTPALLLYIPFRLLPLGDLPPTLAVFIFAFVGFCFSIACLRALAQRFVPDAPRWMLGAAMVALAFGNALPFTLRRIEIYEVAITAGLCLSFIALYLVITGLRDGVRLGRLGAASLLIGLAVGARPTMIVWALGLAAVAVVLYRRMPDRRTRLRIVGVLLGPVAAIGVLLMLYNVLRFGSPADFGQKYMLAGYDPATRDGNKLAYIPPGMWYYLLARPYATLGFPFIYLPQQPSSYPFTLPSQYDGVEPIGGMLPSAPFVVFALVAPLVLRGMARRVAVSLASIGLLIIVMASFALWGATMRYEVDFASVLLIAAALVWLGWAVRLSGLRRRLLAGGGVVLIAWTVACGAAFGVMGYWHALRLFSPKTFKHLQNLTSPLPTLISAIDGEPKAVDVFPPSNLENNIDPSGGVGSVTLVTTKDPLPQDPNSPPRLDALQQPPVLTVVSGSQRRYGLQLTAAPPQPPPRGTAVTIRMPATGEELRIPTTAPPTIYPITLRRGLNRIEFRVTGPPGAFARLADVHIVPLPDAAP
jgi:hypothetical protein